MEWSPVMKTLFRKFALLITLIAVIFSIPVTLLHAEEVDFSCMSYHVKGKIQVSERYKEFDIVLNNHCPGAVYWSMCIERMHPWTNEIQEELTPSGLLQKDKKSRVNLQMKKRPDKSQSRQAFQTFYLDVGYALKPPAQPRCGASDCESKLSGLREKFRTHDVAWQKAITTMATRISTECPQSGWDKNPQTECETKIRSSNQASMHQFAQKDQELKNKMSEVGADRCQIYGSG